MSKRKIQKSIITKVENKIDPVKNESVGLYLLSNYHLLRPLRKIGEKVKSINELKQEVKFLQSKRFNLILKRCKHNTQFFLHLCILEKNFNKN